LELEIFKGKVRGVVSMAKPRKQFSKKISLTPFRRYRRPLCVLLTVLATELTGATTIRVNVNSNRQMCGDFLKMVKRAGVPQMTGDQLCNFRFTQLSPSKTVGFTFPTWQKMVVADPSSTYLMMMEANRGQHSVANPPADLNDRVKAATDASLDKNLAFYTGSMTFDGRAISFLYMDTLRCSKKSYMVNYPPIEYHAAFEDADLKKPIPSEFGGDGELAIWNNTHPVLLHSFDRWGKSLPGDKPFNTVEVENIMLGNWPHVNRWQGISFGGGTICSFTIEK
jgi:hypothetical protein